MRWLLDNWEIKAVALALAVMVYLFTGTLIRVDEQMTIVIDNSDVTGLSGERYQVRSITPREFVIEIDGPQAVMSELEPGDIQPLLVFNRSNLETGRFSQVYDITPRLLQLPPEVRLRNVAVDQIRVEVDRVVRQEMRVAVHAGVFLLPNEALTVTGWQVLDEYVAVRGPRRLIEELKAAGGLPVESVQVPVAADLVEPVTVRVAVPLALPTDELTIAAEEDAETVMVAVDVAPAPGEVTVSLPLEVLAAPRFFDRYVVELHHDEIPVTLRGPRNRLAELDPEAELTAFVDLSGQPEIDEPLQRPVIIRGPPWLVVGQPQARVTVRARRPGSDPEQPAPIPEGGDPGVVVPEVAE